MLTAKSIENTQHCCTDVFDEQGPPVIPTFTTNV